MVIAFANNLAMTAIKNTPCVIYTDPVPLNGMDRATMVWNIHSLWETSGGSATVAYQGEFSNDGTNWLPISGLLDSQTIAGVFGTPQVDVYGAFIRFKFTLTMSGVGGDIGGTVFDLHGSFDKA